MTTYELEHVKMWFSSPAEEGYLDKSEEEVVAESKNIEELKQKAKTIKRKGNISYREELRIIERDEYGDLVDYVWIYP